MRAKRLISVFEKGPSVHDTHSIGRLDGVQADDEPLLERLQLPGWR